jgi:hypothetical protein
MVMNGVQDGLNGLAAGAEGLMNAGKDVMTGIFGADDPN